METNTAMGTKYSNAEKLFKYLTGVLPIPDHLFIGATCGHGHGIEVNGTLSTIRFKQSGVCFKCKHFAAMKSNRKFESRDNTAMDTFNSIERHKERDSLDSESDNWFGEL